MSVNYCHDQDLYIVNGVKIKLLKVPYLTGHITPFYEAFGESVDVGEDGIPKMYRFKWELLDGVDLADPSTYVDDSDVCDWDDPTSVYDCDSDYFLYEK